MLQVRLTRSNSGRTAVNDLIHHVAAELKARFQIDMDQTQTIKLLHLSVQRDEGDEDDDPQVG